MRNIRIAFGLLTILPVGLPENWEPGDSGRAAPWYPVVGSCVGVLVWLVWRASSAFFPVTVSAIITVLVWILLSGGLHLDGLADCCDGLFASVSIEKRLEIMKDPRLGTFGGIGLVMVLLLKTATLVSIAPLSPWPLILAGVFSRWFIQVAGLLPAARSGGMGADFSLGLRRSFILLSAVLPLAAAYMSGMHGFLAILVSVCALAASLWFVMSRINGVTGDVLGMLVELGETIILLVFTIGAR